MKLIRIEGKIWELTCLQDDRYAVNEHVSIADANLHVIRGKSWFNNINRTLSNHGVKSKAIAVIEAKVNGLPQQIRYEIYHNSKGFFCNVQGQRIFLETLLDI